MMYLFLKFLHFLDVFLSILYNCLMMYLLLEIHFLNVFLSKLYQLLILHLFLKILHFLDVFLSKSNQLLMLYFYLFLKILHFLDVFPSELYHGKCFPSFDCLRKSDLSKEVLTDPKVGWFGDPKTRLSVHTDSLTHPGSHGVGRSSKVSKNISSCLKMMKTGKKKLYS